MPRYHFDLVDSKTVADEGGQELPDDATAEQVEGNRRAFAKGTAAAEKSQFRNPRNQSGRRADFSGADRSCQLAVDRRSARTSVFARMDGRETLA
jgi:hypothetical protein